MKKLMGTAFSTTVIAGLLLLVSVENHADELDLYLDNAMHTQVFQELKDNVQRLYEGNWLIDPVNGDESEYARAKHFGFPVANRETGLTLPYRFGVLN